MFTIAETLSKMNIEIFIDESDIGNIKPNQEVQFTTDAFPDRNLKATITQIRYSPIDDQNVITYEVIASFDNPNNILLPGMTANVDIIVENKNDVLKVKNSALSVKLNQKPKKNSGSGNRWGGGASQLQEIMGQLNMTTEQQNKMRGVYPKLGKVRDSLTAKNLSPEKIRKEMQLYIENALIELLSDEQKNKFFELKESLNVKKVYKLVDGEHQKTDLITGLNSGGYTEIINGEIEEGDEVISKVIIETSNKKLLDYFKMIKIDSISKEYVMGDNKLLALNNVNVSILNGEFVSIMGSSGSGKSTLMNIIGCLDVPSSGDYFFQG